MAESAHWDQTIQQPQGNCKANMSCPIMPAFGTQAVPQVPSFGDACATVEVSTSITWDSVIETFDSVSVTMDHT